MLPYIGSKTKDRNRKCCEKYWIAKIYNHSVFLYFARCPRISEGRWRLPTTLEASISLLWRHLRFGSPSATGGHFFYQIILRPTTPVYWEERTRLTLKCTNDVINSDQRSYDVNWQGVSFDTPVNIYHSISVIDYHAPSCYAASEFWRSWNQHNNYQLQ